jgi:hypothetical protein
MTRKRSFVILISNEINVSRIYYEYKNIPHSKRSHFPHDAL